MCEKKQENQNYKISILGDSISTYKGYNPDGYHVYYRAQKSIDNGLTSVDDTWWKQVIDAVGGELCINNSFSGSCTAGDAMPAACSTERCSYLHGETSPDLILVYIGTNDRGFEVELGLDAPNDSLKFYGAYRAMLRKIKTNYPSAKIVCGTLMKSCLKEGYRLPPDRVIKEDDRYNDVIRLAVQEEGCYLADLALSGERYETLDNCHPTKAGHQTMAKLWLENLNIESI